MGSDLSVPLAEDMQRQRISQVRFSDESGRESNDVAGSGTSSTLPKSIRDARSLSLPTSLEPVRPVSSEEKGVAITRLSSLNELQNETQFHLVDVRTLNKVFKQACSADNKLDWKRFQEALSVLEEHGLAKIRDTPIASRLFDIFDINGDGHIDLQEFVTGLNLLCSGTVEEKLELTFRAYDFNNSGDITKSEMTKMLEIALDSSMRIMCSTSGEVTAQERYVFTDMIKEKVNRAFAQFDRDRDGKLSLQEFMDWVVSDEKVVATVREMSLQVPVTLLSTLDSTFKMQFSRELWDGFDSVKEKTEDGLQFCKEFSKFFKSLATLHEEFGQKVDRLCQDEGGRFARWWGGHRPSVSGDNPEIDNEGISFLDCWTDIKGIVSDMAKEHVKFSQHINDEIVNPVVTFTNDLVNTRKTLVEDGDRAIKELNTAIATHEKALAKYFKTAEAAEDAELRFEQARLDEVLRSDKVAKLGEKAVAAKEKTSQAEEEYRSAIVKLNAVRHNVQTIEMVNCLDELQQAEEMRLDLLKSYSAIFSNNYETTCKSLFDKCRALSGRVRAVDRPAEVRNFIISKRSGARPPQDAVFKAYKPKTTSVYNCSLEEIMERQKQEYPSLLVPRILVELTDAIIRLGGCETEGIFRISVNATELSDLKQQFDSGNYELDTNDPHVPACLLKKWLRDLPEPLVPLTFYKEALGAASNTELAQAVVRKLPLVNQNIISYLITFLERIAEPENQAYTKMSVENLAIVFAPSILADPNSDCHSVLAHASQEKQFVISLFSQFVTDEVSTPRFPYPEKKE